VPAGSTLNYANPRGVVGGESRSEFLGDDDEVFLGMLVVFEVTADAATLGEKLEKFGNAERAVREIDTPAGLGGHFAGSIEADGGEEIDSAGVEAIVDFVEDRFLLIEREMPGAVPRAMRSFRRRRRGLQAESRGEGADRSCDPGCRNRCRARCRDFW
jgi:hypothetical protein